MQYLKSLYEALKLSIKSIRNAISSSIKMEKQLKAVRKLTKEYDWKNKTPEEFLEAVRMNIEMGSMNPSLGLIDESQKEIWMLKEEKLLIEYAIKCKKGWIGNSVLNARVMEIEKLLVELKNELRSKLISSEEKVFLHEAELCDECDKVFLSLNPLDKCKDHEGLEKI